MFDGLKPNKGSAWDTEHRVDHCIGNDRSYCITHRQVFVLLIFFYFEIADTHTQMKETAIINHSERVLCTECNTSAQEILHNRNMVKLSSSWVWDNPSHHLRAELAHIHRAAARLRRQPKPGRTPLVCSHQPQQLPAPHVSANRTRCHQSSQVRTREPSPPRPHLPWRGQLWTQPVQRMVRCGEHSRRDVVYDKTDPLPKLSLRTKNLQVAQYAPSTYSGHQA